MTLKKMGHSPTTENYLKEIWALQQVGPATVTNLAEALQITSGSVSAMIRRLSEHGLVKFQHYGEIKLTPSGNRLALDVVRRHRLVETFLVNTLGFNDSEVHDEAERLEHAISKKVVDRLDEFLKFPAVDPHGDPIPSRSGQVRQLRNGKQRNSERRNSRIKE